MTHQSLDHCRWRPPTERPPNGERVLFAGSGGEIYVGKFVITGHPDFDFYWGHNSSNGYWEGKAAPEWWMPIPPLPKEVPGG
jgi:hypothetical protein